MHPPAAQLMDKPLDCRVFEGLCNRINALATALVTGRQIRLQWAVNKHCPVRFEEVLGGLGGVSVVNEEQPSYAYVIGPDELCWFYPRNLSRLPKDVFRSRLYNAYGYLHRQLKYSPIEGLPSRSLGLQFRRHFRGRGGLEPFIEWAGRVVSRLRPAQVYVASDCADCKREIIHRIGQHNIVAKAGEHRLMEHDFDRSLDNVRGMCCDLRALAQCSLGVIANSTRSTIPDSLRAFGVQSYYTFDDGFHRHRGQDELFEMLPVESLLAGTSTQPAPPAWQPFSVVVMPGS